MSVSAKINVQDLAGDVRCRPSENIAFCYTPEKSGVLVVRFKAKTRRLDRDENEVCRTNLGFFMYLFS